MRLAGKTALIAGASRNIGKAIALTFAREGANVVPVASKMTDELQQVARECEAFGVKALPEVPTIAEAGLPEFVYQGWYGMLAPGKTPRKLVNLMSKEVGRIIDTPEIRERIASQGAAAKSSTPEAFDKIVRDEIVTRTKVWKAAGVKID